MAARALSRDDVAFGRAVLLATDSLGLDAEGAFWIYDRESESWRYFLVTSLLESMGPREIYLRLNTALARKLSERETSAFTIYIAAPDEPVVQMIKKHLRTAAHSSEPTVLRRPMACVYRLAPEKNSSAARATQRRFKRLSAEVVAAQ